MRKLITWVLVTLGVAALARKLRNRNETRSAPPEPAPKDPAAELREKLADSRDEGPVKATAPPAETGPPGGEATVDERRTEVHDRGRAAIDEMQQSTED